MKNFFVKLLGLCLILSLFIFIKIGKIDKTGTDLNWEDIKNGSGPVVFLVNGFGGCAPCLTPELKQKLQTENISVYDLDWNDINIRRQRGFSDLTDSKFIQQMVTEVIPTINLDRPLIFIGHSFGADSLLKIAKLINPRQISLLAVLDGVNKLGIRTREIVPPNVDYFYNRWTKNPSLPGGIAALPIPGTHYDIGAPANAGDIGELLCHAKSCDQKEQSYSYKANGLPVLLQANLAHLTDVNYLAKSDIISSNNHSNNHKIVSHGGKNAIYQDSYIQQELFEMIKKIMFR